MCVCCWQLICMANTCWFMELIRQTNVTYHFIHDGSKQPSKKSMAYIQYFIGSMRHLHRFRDCILRDESQHTQTIILLWIYFYHRQYFIHITQQYEKISILWGSRHANYNGISKWCGQTFEFEKNICRDAKYDNEINVCGMTEIVPFVVELTLFLGRQVFVISIKFNF